MDARARKHAQSEEDVADEARVLAEGITAKRDRLLASLTLLAGIGLIVALPFALRSGAEFFMPVTAALVVAIALVPLLEWFERRGIPSKLSAGLCLIIFLLFALFAIGSILIPATDWVAQVPPRSRRSEPRSSRSSRFTRISINGSTGRLSDRDYAGAASDADRQHRAAAFDARPADQLGAPPPDPAVLRAAGDLLLPRRLDRDAEENDR